MMCRHCQIRKIARPKGLCFPCYYSPEIVVLYPSTSKYARRGIGNGNGHARPLRPTDAEPGSAEKLAVIAERIACGVSCDHPDDLKIRHLSYALVAGEPHKLHVEGFRAINGTKYLAGSYDTERFDRPEQR